MRKQLYLLMALIMALSGAVNVRAQCTLIPSSISVTTTSCSTANATWSPFSGAAGYEYVVTTTAPGASGTPVTMASASLSGLAPSTIYFLYVRTECAPGVFSPWTPPFTFMTPSCTCDVPTGFTVGPVSCDSVAFVWSTPSGASGIEYVVNTSPVPPSGSGTFTSGSSAAVGGLSPLTVYYVHIRTVCSGGTYSAWTSLIVTMPACPCTAPTGFSVAAWACDSVVFMWPFPGGYSDWEYVVDMSPVPPSGAGTPASGPAMGVGGLMGGSVYYVHVRTNCGGGTYSAWATMIVTTPPCAACMPPAPASVVPGPTTAMLSWPAVTGVMGYEYVVSTSTSVPAGAGIGIATSSVSVTGLLPGTDYYFFTRSVCGSSSYSDWSSVQAFSTSVSTTVSGTPPAATALIFPDPASALVNIKIPGGLSGGGYITVTAMDGRVVKHVSLHGDMVTLDISDLSSGVYVVTMSDESRTLHARFIKQ